MVQIKQFTFNPFQVNTYILYDDTGECVIIDASCYEKNEKKQLVSFIEEHKLKPVLQLLTHCHIDHMLGSRFISKTYRLKPLTHVDSLPFMENSKEYGKVFGFDVDKPVMPEIFIEDGDILEFGNQELKVIHTPGHAAGSLCYYHKAGGFVIAGDVLFQGSIGRTDLPTGDHDLLIKSILQKLLVLPDATRVYPGHGPVTTIQEEKSTNPYLTGVY
ncbi:MAG: MBL fold metallo-hydrolase [Bacteroidia bacterium]|nr:MAG: MBL fold metallo-hydrolase [Bacteroidia bacterium]